MPRSMEFKDQGFNTYLSRVLQICRMVSRHVLLQGRLYITWKESRGARSVDTDSFNRCCDCWIHGSSREQQMKSCATWDQLVTIITCDLMCFLKDNSTPMWGRRRRFQADGLSETQEERVVTLERGEAFMVNTYSSIVRGGTQRLSSGFTKLSSVKFGTLCVDYVSSIADLLFLARWPLLAQIQWP